MTSKTLLTRTSDLNGFAKKAVAPTENIRSSCFICGEAVNAMIGIFFK